MAVELMSKIKPKGGGTFAMVDASDVEMPDGSRLSDNFSTEPPENGKDGVSATHSWNGTVLTITSASGTSSADLVGPPGPDGRPGDTGPIGPQGPAGTDATVTAENIVRALGYVPANADDISEEETSEAVVLEEQEFSGFTPNAGYAGRYAMEVEFGHGVDAFTIVEGETYMVIWDGEKRSVTAQNASVIMAGALLLGNGSWAFLSGNGEPFAIGWSPLGLILVSLTDTYSNHRVGIYQTAEKAELPAVTAADNGKILQVVDGEWRAVKVADSAVAAFVDDYISSALEGDY